MATQEGFPSEVQKVASDLRISYPELLSSLDQQQQLRRLVNDRKSKAFLCAVITLTGEQPNGYAAGSDGTALTIADLMSQATAAILALESAHSPSRQNVALSLTPARGDGPGAFTAGGNAPAQSSAPGSRRRMDRENSPVTELRGSPHGEPPDQEEDQDGFFTAKVQAGTKMVKHLLPVGKEAKNDWREAIQLGPASSKILQCHIAKLGSSLSYKTDHGLAIGDTESIMEAIPFPGCGDALEARQLKSLVTSEVEVEPDEEYTARNFKVPEAQRSKNKELFSKQKSVRADLFKLALPLVEQTDRLRALTECNGSASELMEAIVEAFSPTEEEDPEFKELSTEQQKEEAVRSAFLHLNDMAAVAAQRASLCAHVLLSRDAELQLQRFANVQPQDDKVKKAAFGRAEEESFKPKGALPKERMAMNQHEELSIGIAAALRQQHQKRQGKQKQSRASHRGERSRQPKFEKKQSDKKPGDNDTGYKGNNWLPPHERKRGSESHEPSLQSRAAKSARKGSDKVPAGRQ